MSINSLPLEILGVIFYEYVRSAYLRHRKIIWAPVRISSVCRRWRDAALSLGVIWAYLDYDFSYRPRKSLLESLDTLLHRSNGAPLNFSFTCNLKHRPFPEDNEVAERAVLMLLSHQWHWEKVRFNWRFMTSTSFPGIWLTNMPKLTSLDLYIKLDDGLYEGGGRIDFSQSSRLEYLRLNCPIHLGIGDKPLFFPVAATIDLDLHGHFSTPATVSQCLDVIEAAPNLRKFRTSSCTVNEAVNYEERPITSNNLQILVMRGGNASLVINKLDLPALTVLTCRDGCSGSAGEHLISFVRRSLPPLTHLSVGGNCADEATVMHILPLLPLLRVLDMDPCTVSARLFQLLSVPNSTTAGSCIHDTHNQIVCPDLGWVCFFNYSVVGGARECADALCAMLDSRWDVLKFDGHLVKIGKPVSETDCERIQHLIWNTENFCTGEDRDERDEVFPSLKLPELR
ncbi:uncharacterized protein FOMMEDRAFT_162099 [Fomitiporia mediterranea MF3/22]|uniref:uncharacterized protein n=1 Tax=Fomitiporia mediterranea (strain MF3/22) TaxID=694068 RepID=UPI0004407D7D|nr:uncharacterized protein FOMMEDRAFT_162099 [Fomitiporia mediterranea MF3/22]EJC98305.1 hypothetical protein FOMMEDRAFT_162099 [Fomitiporia mediterranea MF3/22]